MAKSNIFVGLEIGTHKICVVVGDAKADGSIKILGVGQAPSRGVRKGEIVDFETAQTCLQEALVRAEDRSDVMVRKVWLAITGPHLESVNNRGVLRIPDDQSEMSRSYPENMYNILIIPSSSNHLRCLTALNWLSKLPSEVSNHLLFPNEAPAVEEIKESELNVKHLAHQLNSKQELFVRLVKTRTLRPSSRTRWR